MTYYIKDSIIPVDEDERWEFKAHRNFSSDEVPAWRPDGTKIAPSRAMSEFYKLKNANRTRQPISRNLSGFLNGGKGGTILIGVLDSGKVVGLALNALQKDHLLLSLEDAMRRFKPRIPHEFISVSFIPVIDDLSELEDTADAKLCDPPWEVKRQPHQLRTSSLCWCDVQAMQRFKLGFMPTLYVVEVRIAALHPNLRTPVVAKAVSQLMQDKVSPLQQISWPAFTSEDGNLFCRVLNCLVKYTEDEISRFNYIQTEEFVRNELAYLTNELDENRVIQRLMFLQTLMPEGVVVSKAYLASILNNSEAIEFNTLPNETNGHVQTNDHEIEKDDALSDTSSVQSGTNETTVLLQRTQSMSVIEAKPSVATHMFLKPRPKSALN